MAALGLAVLLLPRASSAQGLLDSVREDVGGELFDSATSSSGSSCDDDNELESFIGELFGPAIAYAAISPWIGPRFLLEGDVPMSAEFLPAPYWHDQPGYVTENYEISQVVGIRLTEELGTNFGDLHRNGLRLQLDTTSRFGLDAEWNHWFEQTPAGTDELDTGDFNLTYRFAQSERAQFHSGLGLNWMADNGAEVGFNFTYGFDLFPVKPWVLSTTLDAGTLGGTGLIHARSTVGVMLNHVELYTGVDWQQIGSTNLTGAVAGLRLWF